MSNEMSIFDWILVYFAAHAEKVIGGSMHMVGDVVTPPPLKKDTFSLLCVRLCRPEVSLFSIAVIRCLILICGLPFFVCDAYVDDDCLLGFSSKLDEFSVKGCSLHLIELIFLIGRFPMKSFFTK